MEEIKICIGYKDAQGNDVYSLNGSEDYEKVTPVYETMPGWSESTLGAQTIDQLPQAAINYIKRLEELMETPIDIVSTGPDRIETVVLRDPYSV